MGDKAQRVKRKASTGKASHPSGRVARALWGRVAELHADGRTMTEIARTINRDQGPVSRTLAEPEVKADVARIQAARRAALDERIKSAASLAWSTLEALLDESEPGHVRRAAADSILDRAGIIARKSVELTGANGGPVQVVSVTPEQLAALGADQLRALAQVDPVPVDGEPNK